MKIESAQFYNWGVFHPFSFDFDREFISIAEVAHFFRTALNSYNRESQPCFMLWLDNWRFILVTYEFCDIHYHYVFNQSEFEKKS